MPAPFRDKLYGDVSELKLSTAFCTYIGVDKMLEEVEYIINSVISIRFAADGVGGMIAISRGHDFLTGQIYTVYQACMEVFTGEAGFFSVF